MKEIMDRVNKEEQGIVTGINLDGLYSTVRIYSNRAILFIPSYLKQITPLRQSSCVLELSSCVSLTIAHVDDLNYMEQTTRFCLRLLWGRLWGLQDGH